MNKYLENSIVRGDEVLAHAYSSLINYAPDTESYKSIVDNIKTLNEGHLRAIELGIKEELEKTKVEADAYKAERELDIQIAQVENEIKSQMMQLMVGAGLQLLGFVNYDVVYFCGLDFEKTGTPCSKFFSTVIQRSSDLLKPKK